MNEINEAWIVAGVIVAPPVIWSVWELMLFAGRRVREHLIARRIIRNTWGDGLP